MDKFIETAQGICGCRVKMPVNSNISLLNQDDDGINDLLKKFYKYLKGMETFMKMDDGLKNIRDEMMADVIQTLYLFTFQ